MSSTSVQTITSDLTDQKQHLSDLDMILSNPDYKSILNPRYLKSISTSKWSKLPAELKSVYDNLNQYTENNQLDKPRKTDLSDIENKLEHLAHYIAERLNLDETLMNNNQIISDCALFAPRYGSTYNRPERPIRFVLLIIQKIYLDTNRLKELTHAIIHYNRLCSKLSSYYVKQVTKNELLNARFKKNRLLEHNRNNWCILKNRPVSINILEPKAMPVDQTPLSEFKPFFDFLKSDQPIKSTHFIRDENCMAFERGTVYEDGRMDLCKQVVGPDCIQNLMNSIKPNSQIKHFLLGNNIIGPNGGIAIKDYLLDDHKSNIQTWYLAGNNLNANAISDIVDGLLTDTNVKHLWLKRNPIMPAGIKHIAKLLALNKTIETLDLHNTGVFDEGLAYLVEGLRSNRTLRLLYLDANNISIQGIQPLIEYFQELIKLDTIGITSLWIDMNRLEDEGIINLVQTLGSYKYLERLNLGSNMMSDVAIDQIVQSFKDHPNLKVLDLGMYKSTGDMGTTTNNMGTNGAIKLAQLIKLNSSIEYLNIMMNGININGIIAIADALAYNQTIKYLEYEQYGLDISQIIRSDIKSKLKANILRSNIINADNQTQISTHNPTTNKSINRYQNHMRFLKHGPSVRYIDSIYRNSSKNNHK